MSAESAEPKNNGRGSISCRSSQRDASAAADRQSRHHRVRRGKAEKLCANFSVVFCLDFFASRCHSGEIRSRAPRCSSVRTIEVEERRRRAPPSLPLPPLSTLSPPPPPNRARAPFVHLRSLSLSSTAVTKARVLLELKRVIHFATQEPRVPWDFITKFI